MQGFELVSSFLLNRKFRASKSPTFHILTVMCNFTNMPQKIMGKLMFLQSKKNRLNIIRINV